MESRPLEDYAPIGDMQSAALIGRDGSLDWLCLPRFDSEAVFTALLGTDTHGYWRIGPATATGAPAANADRRHYLKQSPILLSEWDTSSGTVRVIDFMPPRDGHAPQVIRIVEGLSGEAEVASVLCPRFGYGRHLPWIHPDGGRIVAESGPDALWLDAPPAAITEEKAGTVTSRLRVAAGQRHAFTLSWQPSHATAPETPYAGAAFAATEEFWQAWVAQCTYQGPHREAVVRALITLKTMTYRPTGGIVAALTTSLPEEIGGVRNWDYRYTWLRDAATTLSAMLRTGYRTEAEAWRRWLLRAVGGDPEDLQIMYGVAGERTLTERELHWLPGYAGSRPVRVGNQAAGQLQLDVPGEVIETLYQAHRHGVARCESTAALHLRLVDYVARHWREPDDGIWEVRGQRRHFTHSKIMCWVAVDRTVRLIEDGVLAGDLQALTALRKEIHAEVCAKAYDPARNTFTQSYGSTTLDASLLLLPRTGFLPPDDPRVTGTVDAIRRELGAGDGLVHRYPTAGRHLGADGLPGDEGAFILCSFWLVDALALTGRLPEAKALFERLLQLRSDLGLLAEEYDPTARRQLGNFPQAFSLLGLIESAVLLEALERGRSR
ncbi:glycoside hydrolase family 15 protein [Streptomyces mobaraensis]|uniref:Trehalase n=1 Tax=Streptomyces mobaraensis TaxID=35621 RepID=A0A5N5W153_STRMB|nr:glycoside hydrolase family 15 protein [Streptomyces mobaraensis]KAB7835530.1 glycoside hydrolase family 15 protein [Streptomyces mobaraensis]